MTEKLPESTGNFVKVLVCLVIGYLVGRTTMRRSLKWCRKHLKWLQEHTPLEHGVASVSTASRLLSEIDEELFLFEFMEWIGEIVDIRGLHLAIDGKALRAAAEKEKGSRAPMILNAIETVTGLVVAQLPIQNKDCEITAIPKLLELLNICESTVTIDAIGTQTEIMEQIIEQEGHFVLTVKKNQSHTYDAIMEYLGELSEDHGKMKESGDYKPRHLEMQKNYEEVYHPEKNRERYEHRWYSVCSDSSILTKTQKERPFIETTGRIRQVRIPIERDLDGMDITPDVKTYL